MINISTYKLLQKALLALFLILNSAFFESISIAQETSVYQNDIQPQFLQSLKSTSTIILTSDEFNTWWQNQETNLQLNQKNIYPASLTAQNSNNQQTSEVSTLLSTGAHWSGYAIKVGDTIAIQILGHPELSREQILVTPDGNIDIPLVGVLPVSGVELDTLRAELHRQFAEYLRYPKITVRIEKLAPQKIYIIGAIRHPGIYSQSNTDDNIKASTNSITTINDDYKLTTLIAKAGGLLADADLTHIQVFNQEKLTHHELNILSLLIYGDLSQDITLQPNDVIYVPRLTDGQWNHPEVLKVVASSNIGQDTYPIRIYGLVNKPDVYQLTPNEMTLQSLLAKSGLDVEKARRAKIYISRTMPNQRMVTTTVDSTQQDTLLYPNDVVIVSSTSWQYTLKSLSASLFSSLYMLSGTTANSQFVTNGMSQR